MKTIVLSYSKTGNNEELAKSIAKELAVEHIKVTERKKRTMGSIVADLTFHRTPKVQPAPTIIGEYDLILFLGPVWMGNVATPLRGYMKFLSKNPQKYAYISLCGGADGPNPKLADELKNRVGREPEALIELHIADLLPSDPKPTRNDTMAYRVNIEEIEKLTESVIRRLREMVPDEDGPG